MTGSFISLMSFTRGDFFIPFCDLYSQFLTFNIGVVSLIHCMPLGSVLKHVTGLTRGFLLYVIHLPYSL